MACWMAAFTPLEKVINHVVSIQKVRMGLTVGLGMSWRILHEGHRFPLEMSYDFGSACHQWFF